MDEEKTVWCGNLSDKVTEELLYELFLQAAPLQRVQIPQDKEGRKSNFAFIVFKHVKSVNYATRLLNGISLFDRPLNIKPRSKNQVNDNHFSQFDFRERSEDSMRRIVPNPYHEPMEQNSEEYLDYLMKMSDVMNAATTQSVYSPPGDRRPNMSKDSRNNYRREDRKPYSRNNPRYNRNHNRSFERQRYY